MSKINQIETAILELDAGAYQKLMDCYIMRKYKLPNITPLGSHDGTNKTTKGTPDSFTRCDDGKYILIAYGTVGKNAYGKIESDILDCLNSEKTGINEEDISQIICCHTSTNLTPGQIKALCSHFHNTELIGLGEVSYDLNLNYPDIAKDHLGIDIDTHQILSTEAFIADSAKNSYSTSLDMQLLCRDDETNKLIELMGQNQVLLLFGPSGVGKSRLALEVVKRYSTEKPCIVKIIKSNGESIYQDLRVNFPDENDYVVLVDDANQLTQLHHLLKMCIDKSRKHTIKLILTVRDYAKEQLRKTVREYIVPREYTVKQLSDDAISKILSTNLDINNRELSEHICQIAKGNIRIAIMAGTCAVEERFDNIRNIFDIFNDYYAEIVGSLSKRELLVGGIVAFFDSFCLNDTELPIITAGKYGISPADFQEECIALHRYEVVNLYMDKAIKFENQNLRDYLLYYVFFKEKWIAISGFIYDTFPKYRERIVFSFNTLINLFYTPDNLEYLKKEVQTAWQRIKDSEPRKVLQFVSTFHTVIPDESLLYVKREIENLPVVQNDLLAYDFDEHKNNHEIKSDLLKILVSFKDTEFFSDAIQLALRYLEKNTENPMDIYFLLTDEWGISRLSFQNHYRSERTLLEILQGYFEQNKSILSAFCLLFASQSFMKIEFSCAEQNRNKGITYYHFRINSCDEIYQIRSLSLQGIVSLLGFEPLHKQAVMALLSYPLYGGTESDTTIFTHDIGFFAKNFPLMRTKNEFERCEILNHFEKVCSNNGIEWPDELPKSCENRIYKMYALLSESHWRRQGSYEEAELHRKQRIEKLSNETTLSEFDSLWEALQQREECTDKENTWDLQQGIDQLFSVLAAQDFGKCVKCFDSYLQHEAPYWSQNSIIVAELANKLGYNEMENLILSQDFTYKYQWLNLLHDRIPDEYITEDVCEMFTNWIGHSPDGKNYIISLKTALRITAKFPEFLRKYMQELNLLGKTKPADVSWFMFELERDNEESLSQIIEYFRDDLEILEIAYINAVQGNYYADLDGQLFNKLYDADPKFLTKFLAAITKGNTQRTVWTQLGYFWKRSDFLRIISRTMNYLKEGYSFLLNTSVSVAHALLESNNSSLREIWLEAYIQENNGNREAMKFLFDVLSDFPKDQLRKAVIFFCTYNKNYDDFCNIAISPSSWSCCGSIIPMIESEINYLESLKNDLQGYDYIEHRSRISEIIHAHNEWKEQELLNEFLEGD